MMNYIRLLRPADWIKNCFVFAALVFGARLHDNAAVRLSIVAFALFCMASSAGYILNDILDRERDRQHPLKRQRPIASGAVSIPVAIAIMSGLLTMTAVVSLRVMPRLFSLCILAYVLLTVLYSTVLKFRMLVDVIVIAVLFVLRAAAGAFAIDVAPTPWLGVCTFMLCLFIGFGKRRCEIVTMGNEDAARAHRPVLVRYTPDLLNQLLSTTGGIAIITFLLYTLDPAYTPFANKHQLAYTLPLVVYGIFRYAMLIELGKASGPTDLILRDPAFLATIVLWAGLALFILYWGLPHW